MTYLADLESICKEQPALTTIKLAVFDVDGVLTNGVLSYTDSGETLKQFHVRDGVGLKLLEDMGISVAVITAKDSEMVKQRMSDLGIKHYFAGVKDKAKLLDELSESLGVSMLECAYTGDDMVDLAAMGKAGVSIAPRDAYPLVSELADIRLPTSGGEGVARIVCDLILVAQGRFDEAYKLAALPIFERSR